MNVSGSILLREEFKYCSAFKSVGTKINSIDILDTTMFKKKVRAIVYLRRTKENNFLAHPGRV